MTVGDYLKSVYEQMSPSYSFGRQMVQGAGTSAPSQDAIKNYSSMLETAQKGVDSANATILNTTNRLNQATTDLAAARESAAGMGEAITNVNKSANDLTSYANVLKNLGLDSTNIGSAILKGDTSVGGLAGEYLSAIGLAGDAALRINPDRYVSQAAADVQSSYDNALGQMVRGAERTGVSGSSGNMAALRKQLAESLLVASATAKTRARQEGLTAQLEALTARSNMYKDALTTGESIKKSGAEDLTTAAGIVEKQGGLFANAGDLASKQTSAYANIGGVEVELGNLDLSNQKLVQDSLNSVMSAQKAMADFYANYQMNTLPTTQQSMDANGNYTTSITQKG